MSIEELVERYYASWARQDMTMTQAMTAALTEQSETHALELRAYEATVQNLEQRIRELESQRVPNELRANLIVGCDEITSLCRYLRHGGCDSSDLSGLEEGLSHAIDVASEMISMLAALTELAVEYEEQLEVERMRLAACGVIAMSNTAESASKARQMRPEYWSASAEDCANAVDREMALRERIRQLEAARLPEGWQRVPIEPTEKMRSVQTWDFNRFYTPREIWAAMLAAAPQPKEEWE